jgi:nitrogen fixation/metabolism regulation signal transduction histidine kinase
MKLQLKFTLFIVCIHAIALVLSYFVFEQNKLVFLLSELVILVSIALSWSLYNDLIRPLQLMVRGADAIQDRDFTVRFVPTGIQEMDKLIGVYNEMIDQLRQERTLQEEQHFFLEKLIQTSPTGILMFDFDQQLYTANPRAATILGLKAPVLAAPIPEHPLLQAVVSMPMGSTQLLQLGGVRKFKAQKAQFIDRGFARAFVMLEELTVEILEAEKAAYGKVIRMMAHEVNNSIGAVNSILHTLLQRDPAQTLSPRDFQALQVSFDRNEHLNQFMRRFADVIRLPQPRKEPFDVHDLLREVATLMSFKAGENGVSFLFELAPQPLLIQADRPQMEQALINIVKNAIEAIPGEGSVTFSTTLYPKGLRITDTGTGIDPAITNDLFSPFFTTKNKGQGVGLTLIREVFSSHGYGFSLQTVEPGKTVFWVEF